MPNKRIVIFYGAGSEEDELSELAEDSEEDAAELEDSASLDELFWLDDEDSAPVELDELEPTTVVGSDEDELD